MTTPVKAPMLRDSQRTIIERTLDATADKFRRSLLSAALYPTTSPRSRQKADQLADAALKWLSNAGRIERVGHLHWVKVSRERKLCSGRTVPEHVDIVNLIISTRCPRKWVSVDMETGDVWIGETKGWKRASVDERKEALSCIKE